jgi:hypothetical protein
MFPHLIMDFTLVNFPRATIQSFLPESQVDDDAYWNYIKELAHFLGCFILPKYMIKSFVVHVGKIPDEYNEMKFEYKRYCPSNSSNLPSDATVDTQKVPLSSANLKKKLKLPQLE